MMNTETPAPGESDPLHPAWEWETAEDMQLQLAGHWSREEYLRDRRVRADWVADRLALTEKSAVFEIGSGEGVMAAELAPRVGSFLCADVSRSFLDQARATCRPYDNVSFHHIVDDYLDPLPDTSFDAGFSFNVLIHLDLYAVYHYFLAVRRILRPGGLFVFNHLDLGERTRSFFLDNAAHYRGAHPVALEGFLTWYGRDLIAKAATEAGLVPLVDEYVDEGGVGFLTLRSEGVRR